MPLSREEKIAALKRKKALQARKTKTESTNTSASAAEKKMKKSKSAVANSAERSGDAAVEAKKKKRVVKKSSTGVSTDKKKVLRKTKSSASASSSKKKKTSEPDGDWYKRFGYDNLKMEDDEDADDELVSDLRAAAGDFFKKLGGARMAAFEEERAVAQGLTKKKKKSAEQVQKELDAIAAEEAELDGWSSGDFRDDGESVSDIASADGEKGDDGEVDYGLEFEQMGEDEGLHAEYSDWEDDEGYADQQPPPQSRQEAAPSIDGFKSVAKKKGGKKGLMPDEVPKAQPVAAPAGKKKGSGGLYASNEDMWAD